MQNLKLIGEKIKKIRKNRKISQEKLAEMISMNQRSILRIENAQSLPTIETLQKISNVLNVNITDFFENEELKNKEEIIADINKHLEMASEEKLKIFYKAIHNFLNY